LGQKVGLVNQDEDQVDQDRTKYANFIYAQQQQEMNNRILNNESPPAYDYATTDGQWLKNIKDKADINSKDRKH
jgi:hypothetical protein